MIFDANMDFTSKSWYVATGFHAYKSDESRYVGVVSCESVCTAFTYAYLDGVDIVAADMHNAYLTELLYENYWTRCGPGFGLEHEGNKSIDFWSHYEIPCAGQNFWELLCGFMKNLVF